MTIHLDYASEYLRKRWIVCYMLYDWNIKHANNSFFSNEVVRYQRVCELMKTEPTVSDAIVTKTYNQVLAEDIEEFIQHLMQTGTSDRLRVEIDIAATLSELTTVIW